jgi:hypothetical protein
MSTITRTWLAFAAIGAGLIHLALVIGSPLPVGIALVGLGVAELGWGIMTFLRDAPVAPRAALVGSIAPIVLWSLVVVASTLFQDSILASSLELFPLAIATLFQLFIAGVLSVHLRRKAEAEVEPTTPSAWRYLVGVLVGGIAVSMLTTPALAATEAGLYAQPHGEHSESFVPEQDAPATFELPEHGEEH